MAVVEGANGCRREEQRQLRCVMLPMLAMGHIIPMMDLGLLLAEEGVSVTLFTTTANAKRLLPAVGRAQAASLPFTVTSLPFRVEGLNGIDNADLTTSAAEFEALIFSLGQLEAPFREHLRGIAPCHTFMVVDFCLPWSRAVSEDLGIPRYIFYSAPCFTLLCHRLIPRQYDAGAGGSEGESAPFVFRGLPHRIELTRDRLPGIFTAPEWSRELDAAEGTADGIIVNTFATLERDYLELFQKDTPKTVWPIGPVALCNSEDPNTAAPGGSMPAVGHAQILEWLERQRPRSVVYICLGSLAQTTPEQAMEIGLGLEASGHSFLWVVRARGSQLKEIEDWLAAGFESRTKDRGLIVREWAPQQLILSHAAIGGFVTHCGWNSISEALASGVPLATWPCFGDQFVNERFLVDVLGVGVAVGVKEPQWWWSDGLKVGRERVEEVVRELMGGGEEPEKRQTRAMEIGVEARKAMQVGKGLSRRTLAALVQDAAQRAGQRRDKV